MSLMSRARSGPIDETAANLPRPAFATKWRMRSASSRRYPGFSTRRQKSVTADAIVSTARRIASSRRSAFPTILSSGTKNVAPAASSIIVITPRAERWRSSPSNVNGVVAKTIDGMPSESSRFTVSSVAPPPVPPPSDVTMIARRTPSIFGSSEFIESSVASLAATTSPPEPRPERRLPPRSRKSSQSAADAASVSIARNLSPSPKARRTPRAIAEPPPPMPMSIIEDESLI